VAKISTVIDHKKSKGNFFADTNGNVLLDLSCNMASLPLGYNHDAFINVSNCCVKLQGKRFKPVWQIPGSQLECVKCCNIRLCRNTQRSGHASCSIGTQISTYKRWINYLCQWVSFNCCNGKVRTDSQHKRYFISLRAWFRERLLR